MYEKSPGKKAKSDQGENDEYSLSSYKYLIANLPNLFSNIGSLLSNWTFQLEGFLLGFKSLSTDKILILTTSGLSSSGKSTIWPLNTISLSVLAAVKLYTSDDLFSKKLGNVISLLLPILGFLSPTPSPSVSRTNW